MFNALFGRCGHTLAAASFFLAVFLLAPASTGMAAGTVLGTGFENPPFTLGPLQGQPTVGDVHWGVSGGGASTAVVQNSITPTGSGQAVQVTRAANSDKRWAVPNLAGVPTQRFVTVDWDMRVAATTGGAGTFGPFFGVEAYATNSGLLLGSLGVDATTSDILYQREGDGVFLATGSTVTFDTWYHYQLVFDFVMHRYEVFVNSMSLGETGFVDGATLNTFTDADIAAVAASGDAASLALTGSAVFDNFIIRDGLPGDYDADGKVEPEDYGPWRATFGSTVTAGHGADGNNNGIVDAADYVVWRNNLGVSLFPMPGVGSMVVPEPAGFLMALLALAATVFSGARRRR